MPFEPPFERLHQPPNPPPADDQVDYEALQRKPIWRVTDLVAYLGLESEQVVYKWHAEGKNAVLQAGQAQLLQARRRARMDGTAPKRGMTSGPSLGFDQGNLLDDCGASHLRRSSDGSRDPRAGVAQPSSLVVRI